MCAMVAGLPSNELEDGVDYVPAPPYVVLGHHFSSIAGAGPINGPIQAAVFGWVPVLLWVLIGGIFFGAMHDFGALFASLRHKGQTLAVVVAENHETQAVAAAALEKVPQAIVDANSVDVDGVSGATLTSGRIKDAAVKCLTQAAQ